MKHALQGASSRNRPRVVKERPGHEPLSLGPGIDQLLAATSGISPEGHV